MIRLEGREHLHFASSAGDEHVVAETMAFLQEEQALLREVHLRAGHLAEAVFFRDHKNKGLAKKLAADQIGLAKRKANDDYIEISSSQLFNEVRRDVFCQDEINFGIESREFPKMRCDEIGKYGRDGSYSKRAADSILELADMCLCKFGSTQNVFGVGVKDLPSVGQTHGSRKANKKGRTNRFLEAANLQRERRLCYPFLLSGFGKAPETRNRTEVLKLLKFHLTSRYHLGVGHH
jgi:hypothetical protein